MYITRYEAFVQTCSTMVSYRRAPFLRATNFANGLKKEVQGNYFHESTSVSSLQSAICITIKFPLIFGETNFVKVPKSTRSMKFVALEKRYYNMISHMQ